MVKQGRGSASETKFGLFPHGQRGKWNEETDSRMKFDKNVYKTVTDAEIKRFKENWPQGIASFELWSKNTCYVAGNVNDKGELDGGAAFQRMMTLMLCSNGNKHTKMDVADNMDPASIKAHGYVPPRVGDDPKMDTVAEQKVQTSDMNGGTVGQGRLAIAPHAMNNGHASSKPRPWEGVAGTRFYGAGNHINPELQSLIQSDNSYGPATQLDWHRSTGMKSTPAKVMPGKKGGRCEMNTLHYFRSNYKNDEADGCVSMGDRAAAYFGLYYYPNCEDKRLNWVVQQTIGGKVFLIRMRYPNPAYTYEVNTSRVKVTERGWKRKPDAQPNKDAAKEIWGGMDEDIEGGFHGFYMPKVTPRSPWDELAFYHDPKARDDGSALTNNVTAKIGIKTRLEGYTGFLEKVGPQRGGHNKQLLQLTAKPGGQPSVVGRDEDYKKETFPTYSVHASALISDYWQEYIAENASEHKGFMYERENFGLPGLQEGQLTFGFSMPEALYLYPHYDHGKGTWEIVKHNVNKHEASTTGYQPWPKWRQRPNLREPVEVTINAYNAKENTRRQGFKPGTQVIHQSVPQGQQPMGFWSFPFNPNAETGASTTPFIIFFEDKPVSADYWRWALGLDFKPIVAPSKAELILDKTDTSDAFKPYVQALIKDLMKRSTAQDEDDEPEPVVPEAAADDDPQVVAEAAADVPAMPDIRDVPGAPAETRDDGGGRDDGEAFNEFNMGAPEDDQYLQSVEDYDISVALEGTTVSVSNQDTTMAIELNVREGLHQQTQAQNEIEGKGKVPLREGEARRVGDTANNYHFQSLFYTPWSPKDVWLEPRIHYKIVEFTNVEKDVNEYMEKYGSGSNLVLRSEKPGKLVIDPDSTNGNMRYCKWNGVDTPILDMPIAPWCHPESEFDDVDDENMFIDNMRRIVSIYFDKSGALGYGSCKIVDFETKQDGMEKGIWRPAGNTHACQVNYEAKGKPILPAVFTNMDDALYEKLEYYATDEKENLWRGNARTGDFLEFMDRDSMQKGPRKSRNDFTKAILMIESKMTVSQWLQTPWHYEYLPYLEMSSVFKEGESFCRGCTRCSRPFYEFEYLYAAFDGTQKGSGSHPKTKHWPHMYWRGTHEIIADQKDMNHAPKPFHHPAFWSPEPVQAVGATRIPQSVEREQAMDVTAARAAAREATEKAGGAKAAAEIGENFHGWKTFAFLLGWGWKKGGRREKGKLAKVGKVTKTGNTYKYDISGGDLRANQTPLWKEWCDRVGRASKLVDLFTAFHEGKPFTFRQYLNHMYDGKTTQRELMQGMIRPRAKVAYGMQGYQLMRSIKYGNVCRDCAMTLVAAPHLFVRTGAMMRAGHVSINSIKDARVDNWWIKFAGQQTGKSVEGSGWDGIFDPWFVYIQAIQFHDRKARYAGTVRATPENERQKLTTTLDILGNREYILGKRKSIDDAKNTAKRYEEIFGGSWREITEKHIEFVMEQMRAKTCAPSIKGKQITKVIKPASVSTQCIYTPENTTQWNELIEDDFKESLAFLGDLIDKLQTEPGQTVQIEIPKMNKGNRSLFDMLHQIDYEIKHRLKFKRESGVVKYDPNLRRVEQRGDKKLEVFQLKDLGKLKMKPGGGGLVTLEDMAGSMTNRVSKDWNGDTFPEWATEHLDIETGMKMIKRVYTAEHGWKGDAWLNKLIKRDKTKEAWRKQVRRLTQSRMFITYALHRRVYEPMEARYNLEKMADAVRCLFGNDEYLCKILIFGRKLIDMPQGGDATSKKFYEYISKPNKEDKKGEFWGNVEGNSYESDTYQTHIEQVEVDAGIEIGPKMHHPHFHCLLNMWHWSYVQVDKFRMAAELELMFKGIHPTLGDQFMLLDGKGLPFYGDNENPYIDFRMYPSDDWQEVIAAYVRKGTDRETMLALRERSGANYLDDRPIRTPN